MGKELDGCGLSSLGRRQPLSHASPKVCTGSSTTEFVSWSREVPDGVADGVAPLQWRLRARAFRLVALRVRRGPRSCARVHQTREGARGFRAHCRGETQCRGPTGRAAGRREHSSRLSPGGSEVLQGGTTRRVGAGGTPCAEGKPHDVCRRGLGAESLRPQEGRAPAPRRARPLELCGCRR